MLVNEVYSTSYYNLVAVCADSKKDALGNKHCDNSRRNTLLPPVIFHKDYTCPGGVNYNYFIAEEDGTISVKGFGKDIDWNIWMQLQAFISILNLNHETLILKRQEILKAWDTYILNKTVAQRQAVTKKQRLAFWRFQFDAINANPEHPFRQFLLIYLSKKIGA